MFGTGESASSASESTRPSRTSSSWRSGTYCRQIGSPGARIKSTMAGEIRNSKFSAAWRRRSRSGKCAGPNLATSASSDAMLRLRSSSCQDSMGQVLEIDHQVVARGVVPREASRPGVAAPLVEGARGGVFGTGRGFDDDESSVIRRQLALNGLQQLRPDSLPLARRVHDDPVKIERARRTWGRSPTGVPRELVVRVSAEEVVVVVPGEGLVEQVHGDGDFLRPEQAGGRREPLKRSALRAADGTERAAHAPPWRPAPRGAPPRRSGVPAPRNPSPPRAPCATGRRRRSGPDWDSLRAPTAGPGRRRGGRPARTPFPAWYATRSLPSGRGGRRASGELRRGTPAPSRGRRASRSPTFRRR